MHERWCEKTEFDRDRNESHTIHHQSQTNMLEKKKCESISEMNRFTFSLSRFGAHTICLRFVTMFESQTNVTSTSLVCSVRCASHLIFSVCVILHKSSATHILSPGFKSPIGFRFDFLFVYTISACSCVGRQCS